MAEPNRINCETFRVSMGVGRDIAVRRGYGIIRDRDVELEGSGPILLDPKAQPEIGWPYDRIVHEEACFALSPEDPPARPRRMVHSFSMDAWWRLPSKAGFADHINPIEVHSPVERPIARAALVSLIEYGDEPAAMGSAYILNQDPSALTMQEMRLYDDELGVFAGVSVVLLPESGSLTFRQEPFSIDHELIYDPDSDQGLFVRTLDAGGSRPEDTMLPPDDPGDPDGDRQPRGPRRPLNSGAVSLEEPGEDQVLWARGPEA